MDPAFRRLYQEQRNEYASYFRKCIIPDVIDIRKEILEVENIDEYKRILISSDKLDIRFVVLFSMLFDKIGIVLIQREKIAGSEEYLFKITQYKKNTNIRNIIIYHQKDTGVYSPVIRENKFFIEDDQINNEILNKRFIEVVRDDGITAAESPEQPPVEQPPVEQPPVEQPPVEQPPVELPPAEVPDLQRVKDTLATCLS